MIGFSISYGNQFVKSLVNLFAYSIVNILCFLLNKKRSRGFFRLRNTKADINYKVEPKSVTMDWPVMARDSSDAKKRSILATSSGIQG